MNENTDIIRGSGNVFRDLGHPDADREQLRALLAARIIGVLEQRGLTVRAARELTGVAAADFSRIRKADLGRFTIDRLMAILSGLGQEVVVTVDIRPRGVAQPVQEIPSSVIGQTTGTAIGGSPSIVSGNARSAWA